MSVDEFRAGRRRALVVALGLPFRALWSGDVRFGGPTGLRDGRLVRTEGGSRQRRCPHLDALHHRDARGPQPRRTLDLAGHGLTGAGPARRLNVTPQAGGVPGGPPGGAGPTGTPAAPTPPPCVEFPPLDPLGERGGAALDDAVDQRADGHRRRDLAGAAIIGPTAGAAIGEAAQSPTNVARLRGSGTAWLISASVDGNSAAAPTPAIASPARYTFLRPCTSADRRRACRHRP
jgi:hypothetical protein